MKLSALLCGAVAALGVTFSTAQAQDMIDVTVGAATASDHAPAFAALEKGFFAKHGLNAKIVIYPTGVDMINGLLGGQQSINVMGSVPFLAGISNGLPLVLIGHLHGDAAADNYSLGHSIVTGPESGISSLADLKGKRIGLPRGTGAEGYLTGVLAGNGIALEETTLVNIKPADLPTALAQKDVEAIAVWEPWPSTALVKVDGSQRLISGGCATCYFPAAFLTSRKVIADNPEIPRRFMSAISEAEQWVRNNLDEAAEINMHWIPGIELEVMKKAVREAHYDPRISAYTVEEFKAKTIPTLLSGGQLKKEVDPTDAIDASFIVDVMKNNAEYFSDLKEIPEDKQLN